MRRKLSDQMGGFIVAFGLSRWSTLGLAGMVAFGLLVFGVSPSSALFWIILCAAVGPFVFTDLYLYVSYARRGQSYSHVRREAGRLTLEEIRRRREAKQDAG